MRLHIARVRARTHLRNSYLEKNDNLECFVLVVVDIFFFVGLFACDDMMLGISILSSFVQNFEA